jgi:hydroxymethylpyrimidine pyrophosphatase-like HAD family hydrolase
MDKTSTPEKITGRSIFAIETTADGIKVQTLFLTEDGKYLEMPAIFPEQNYALAQIEELRLAVIKHFAQAAQVGVKVIAQSAELGPSSDDTIQ